MQDDLGMKVESGDLKPSYLYSLVSLQGDDVSGAFILFYTSELSLEHTSCEFYVCYSMLHKTCNATSINIGHFTLRCQLTSRFISSYSEAMGVVSGLRPAIPKSLRLTVSSSFQKILGLHHKTRQDRFLPRSSL